MSLKESEALWQAWVVDLAAFLGWRWGHIGKGRVGGLREEGRWLTPVTGPLGAGHPDLLLARERIVYVECKTNSGTLRKEQKEWISTMRKAGGEVYVWRPRDRAAVERVLK